ncbi:hypothetical protein BcepF1.121 [Burkholderia phage BcepF1]|uniref:Uncharacterized protein n=1 Tax=Burkholderia phage BcepF1 TaxID=2886897 RepID=A1Z025_9CAUD|nr:hypothetical protein BcepF1.121 [Burkholderia phage BcepF1]ABL96852.1 hypothetical protein BcepF1.121 [Burkholderia phage BcepF1]
MPLSTGTSKAAREENIEREIAAGKDPKQAVAIGYAQQRRNAAKSHDAADIKSIYDKLCEVVNKM